MSTRPIVALIGRPNAGKSTLFNRLVGKRLAIVHDEPGVTRDRHYADTETLGQPYTLIDTGGFDPDSDDPMRRGIIEQIEIALAQADIVVCVLDGRVPPLSVESEEIALLRASEKPVLYLANKCDSERLDAEAMELYRLGLEELILASALHGRGIDELEQRLAEVLRRGAASDAAPAAPEVAPASTNDEDEPAPPQEDHPLHVAVVGRPNAGKSSLINRLLGEDRLLVDARPGTTRDPIDTVVERRGNRFVFVDTAGIRRKSRVAKTASSIEAVSVIRAIRAMDRARIAVVLCDAARGVEEQDAKILGLAIDRGRGLVIALNKTDLLSRDQRRTAERDARDVLSFAPWVSVEQISALTGRGVNRLLQKVRQVGRSFEQRVPTGELNRFFEEVLAEHPPPIHRGRQPRFYFVTQAQTAPPLFVVECSNPDNLHFSYQRYVTNAIRKRFGFEGVPVRVRYRRSGRRQRKHKRRR